LLLQHQALARADFRALSVAPVIFCDLVIADLPGAVDETSLRRNTTRNSETTRGREGGSSAEWQEFSLTRRAAKSTPGDQYLPIKDETGNGENQLK
jgi:hypothetical protein